MFHDRRRVAVSAHKDLRLLFLVGGTLTTLFLTLFWMLEPQPPAPVTSPLPSHSNTEIVRQQEHQTSSEAKKASKKNPPTQVTPESGPTSEHLRTSALVAAREFDFNNVQRIWVAIDASDTAEGIIANRIVRVRTVEGSSSLRPSQPLHSTRTDRTGMATLAFTLPSHVQRIAVSIDQIGVNNLQFLNVQDGETDFTVTF